MGRRDEPELTPSDADLAASEAATRDLLARYGEPAHVEPPPGLVRRVVAMMPEAPPGRPARRPWWSFPSPVAVWGLTALAALLIFVGGWAAAASAAVAAGVAAIPGGLLGRVTSALANRSLGSVLSLPAPAATLIGLGLVIAVAVLIGLRSRR